MTYSQARKIYAERFGNTIKDSWIAEILRFYGKTTRKAPNRVRRTKNPCPKKIRKNLKKILKELDMI